MKLLDSNILIYAPRPAYAHLLPLLLDQHCFVSDVSRLEVLGFHKLSLAEKTYYEEVFQHKNILPITRDVIDVAIQLRQAQKMSVGDSIVAATALLHGLELLTRNTSDFLHITGLRFFDPV
jgi:hypothetical protein